MRLSPHGEYRNTATSLRRFLGGQSNRCRCWDGLGVGETVSAIDEDEEGGSDDEGHRSSNFREETQLLVWHPAWCDDIGVCWVVESHGIDAGVEDGDGEHTSAGAVIHPRPEN